MHGKHNKFCDVYMHTKHIAEDLGANMLVDRQPLEKLSYIESHPCVRLCVSPKISLITMLWPYPTLDAVIVVIIVVVAAAVQVVRNHLLHRAVARHLSAGVTPPGGRAPSAVHFPQQDFVEVACIRPPPPASSGAARIARALARDCRIDGFPTRSTHGHIL